MAEINDETIRKPMRHVVYFTIEPPFRLNTYNASDETITEAVAQAEILARTLESEKTPFDVVLIIRAVLYGSCMHIAKSLDKHLPEAEMLRDIYPYARAVEPEKVESYFLAFLVILKSQMPEMYNSIFGGQENEK